jgi:EAL domain-containing protein (putative c-di-GMP-specific phosphodiesterase class I)
MTIDQVPFRAVARPALRADEAERLASLRALEVVDTEREPVFDWLAGLTASQLQAPVAIISLLDESRLFFKAVIGVEGTGAPRAGSICEWVVFRGGFFEVPDAAVDPRFAGAGMAAAGMSSYAGAPIFSADGQPVGSLCVLDTKPRSLTGVERHRLEQMAELVTGQLHLRQARAGQPDPAEDPSSELQRAMMTGALLPYYQPIVSMLEGTTVGCEALARWRHPTQGLLSPAAFLEIAERDNLIVDLDFRILDRACRQVTQWWEDPLLRDRPTLSINISGRHLASRDLVDDIRAVLEGNGMPGDALTIEVSESILGGAADSAVPALNRLRDLGVSLTLDDFGATQSSPTYLQTFPVNGLKIHHSFVAGLGAGGRNQTMVESTLRLARRLELDVTAVGVETEAQADILRNLGCPKAQGYLYAPALPAEELRLRLSH